MWMAGQASMSVFQFHFRDNHGNGWNIDVRHGGVRLSRWIASGKQHKNPRETV